MNHKITIQFKIKDFHTSESPEQYTEEEFMDEVFKYVQRKIDLNDIIGWIVAPEEWEEINDFAKSIEVNLKLEINKQRLKYLNGEKI